MTVTIENFGSYNGKNEFDLSVSEGKPIVLIGGKNGAGKTTFLEAIKFALYGQRGINDRISKSGYQQIIRERRHIKLAPNQQTEVRLVFQFVKSGKIETYSIIRRWVPTSKNEYKEFLKLAVDGKPVTNQTEDAIQSIIDSMIPPSLAELFFINAEDLKVFMADGNLDVIRNSLQKLLGLQYINQLEKDLNTQLKNIAQKNNKSEIEKYNSLVAEINQLENKLEQLTISRGETNTQVASLKKKIEMAETRFLEQGGRFAEKHDENKKRLETLEGKLEILREDIRRMAAEYLPLLVVDNHFKNLFKKVREEHMYALDLKVHDRLKEFLMTEKFVELGLDQDELKKFMPKLLEKLKPPQVPMKYNLSEKEIDTLKFLSQLTETQVRDEAITKFSEYISLKRESETIKNSLALVPQEENIAPLYRELKELLEKKSKLVAKSENLTKELQEGRTQLDRARRNLEKLKKTLKIDDVSIKDRILKLQEVLKEYKTKKKKMMIRSIEKQTLENFRLICSKGKLISKIQINPSTYSIKIFDNDGKLWLIKYLSDGEKQLFALALLWAMAIQTGKHFPYILDTPLGRLDTGHRQDLVNQFFGKAADQMILTSTNEEVDDVLFETILPYVSKTYLLEYDFEKKETIVHKDRYFSRKITQEVLP